MSSTDLDAPADAPDRVPGRGDERRARPVPTGWSGALAGFVAAGVALGVGELITATEVRGPSLVEAVGTEFIDRFAAALKDIAVALFGTNDKTALVVGIVIVSLALGTLTGHRVRAHPWRAGAVFGAFGVVGLLSYLGSPLGSAPVGWFAAIGAALAGTLTYVGLVRIAPVEPTDDEAVDATVEIPATADEPDDASTPTSTPARGPVVRRSSTPGTGRRQFLVSAGALALGAAGAAAFSRTIRGEDLTASTRRSTTIPRPTRSVEIPATQPFDVEGLTPYVVPNGEFYRIDTALSSPQVDATTWELRIDGMVDTPLTITYDDLLSMDSVETPVTLSCVSNEVGGGLVGNAVWQGVPLATLLERAGVQEGADQIVGRSVDDWTAGFPTELAFDGRTALVAYAMNGELLPVDHGFPARLVVAGLYGYVSATKWLTQIELTTWDDFDGYWIPRGWSKEGPIKLQSRIDVPDGPVAAGTVAVAGVAWDPNEGVERVEVRVDEGDWQECRLGEAANDDTWVQWVYEWDATPGRHEIEVRATNRLGEVQTDERTAPAPNGATGHHRRTVRVTES